MKQITIPGSISIFLFVILINAGCQSPAEKASESKTSANEDESNLENLESGIFELRTYYAADGKLEDLLSRFRNHTVSLFEKHGMQNIAYWVPISNDKNLLIYLLGFPTMEIRDSSFASFRQDPDWLAVKKESELNGILVDSVKSLFLHLSDFSPTIKITDEGPRVFELRTYYTNAGKLEDLHTRFREHTMDIFKDHNMTNVAYFNLESDQAGSENTLVYIISHASLEKGKQNWEAFIDDPEWKSVYQASIENGRLVDSLTSTFLQTLDFSPMK